MCICYKGFRTITINMLYENVIILYYIIYNYNIMNAGVEFLSKIGLLLVSIIVFTTFMFMVGSQLSIDPATKMVILSTYVFIMLIFIVI